MSTRYLAVFAAAAVLLTGCPGTAQAGDGGDLSSAGSADHFRVIDRFPNRDAPASGDIPEIDRGDPLYPVVQHVEREEWSEALDLVDSDELTEVLDANGDRRFLAGYVAFQAEEFERALHHFDAIGGELDLLEDYRIYYAARAAFEAEDFHRATLLSARVPEESRFYDDALLLLAQSLEENGENEDLRRGIEILELYIDRYPSNSDLPAARLLLGELYEAKERYEDAARTYLTIREEHPLGDEADTAEEHFRGLTDQIDDELAEQIDSESIDRTMRRFRALHSAHRSEDVIDGLSRRIEEFPEDAESRRCEALYMVADSHTKLRRHGDAVGWYDQILDECTDVENYEIRALYRTARSRWNDDDNQGALEVYERLVDDYPDHSYADDAMYFSARIHRSADRPEQMREVLREQVERYPDGDMAKNAHWLLVRDFFEREDYEAAVDYVDNLDDTGEDDLYTRGRLAYFRARALEMDEDAEGAETAFAEVAEDYPMSYYALLALNRLGRLAGSADTGIFEGAESVCDGLFGDDSDSSPVEIPDRLSESETFERGIRLVSLGLNDHARSEFSSLRRSDDDSLLWALASLLDRAGAYPLSHDIPRRHIDGWQREYPTAETITRWKIAYPIPFNDEVNRWTDQRDLEPGFVYAVMREESGFNPTIQSWANARGLLQLLDDTAERMARRDGLDGYAFARLDDPETNVRLGTAYMEYTGERVASHPVLIAASYNAGSSTVSEWLDEFGDLPLDLFVEDIPYRQTRMYAKRVLTSYWIYTYLYGNERVPLVAFELQQ